MTYFSHQVLPKLLRVLKTREPSQPHKPHLSLSTSSHACLSRALRPCFRHCSVSVAWPPSLHQERELRRHRPAVLQAPDPTPETQTQTIHARVMRSLRALLEACNANTILPYITRGFVQPWSLPRVYAVAPLVLWSCGRSFPFLVGWLECK